MARLERFELPTARFVAEYSIQLSYRRLIRKAGFYGYLGGFASANYQEVIPTQAGILRNCRDDKMPAGPRRLART